MSAIEFVLSGVYIYIYIYYYYFCFKSRTITTSRGQLRAMKRRAPACRPASPGSSAGGKGGKPKREKASPSVTDSQRKESF